MARAYGVDLQKRVIEAIEEGLSTREAARRFRSGYLRLARGIASGDRAAGWSRAGRASRSVRN